MSLARVRFGLFEIFIFLDIVQFLEIGVYQSSYR